eukprot:GHVS01008791.1.p1 GENE.GHVS01008791.1~~GHVS01008791.1.p1  ORF type:complete len:609 (-),score=22.37 GHVS01008791.1:1057-2709(-)
MFLRATIYCSSLHRRTYLLFLTCLVCSHDVLFNGGFLFAFGYIYQLPPLRPLSSIDYHVLPTSLSGDHYIPNRYDIPPTTLCTLPYLVSTPYPQAPSDLAGLTKDGYIDINLRLEMANYYSNLLPISKPPYSAIMSPHHNVTSLTGEEHRVVELSSENVNMLNNTFIVVLGYTQWLEYTIGRHQRHILSLTTNSTNNWNSHIRAHRRYPLTSAGPFSRRIHVDSLDRYSVVLLNSDVIALRLSGSVSYVNPHPYLHLSREQAHTAVVVAILAVVYLGSALLLAGLFFTAYRGLTTPVHLLMLVNWLVCALFLSLDFLNCRLFREWGELPTVIWASPRVVRKVQEILGLMIFFFVSLGWKILRTRLTRLEAQFAAGISVVSFAMGMTEIFFDRIQYWRYILHLLVLLCTSIAISFNITLLHSHLQDAGISLSTSDSYRKYQGFRSLRTLFYVYLAKQLFWVLQHFKGIALQPVYEDFNLADPVISGSRWMLSWDEWIFVLVDGLAEYAIYVWLLFIFRPAGPIELFKDILDGREELDQPGGEPVPEDEEEG